MLIVVRPNDTALYEYLLRSLAGVQGVTVIPERRRVDRRREQSSVAGRAPAPRAPNSTRQDLCAGLHRRRIQTESPGKGH